MIIIPSMQEHLAIARAQAAGYTERGIVIWFKEGEAYFEGRRIPDRLSEMIVEPIEFQRTDKGQLIATVYVEPELYKELMLLPKDRNLPRRW